MFVCILKSAMTADSVCFPLCDRTTQYLNGDSQEEPFASIVHILGLTELLLFF